MNIGYTTKSGDTVVKEFENAEYLSDLLFQTAEEYKDDESIISFYASYQKDGETVKIAKLRRRNVQD